MERIVRPPLAALSSLRQELTVGEHLVLDLFHSKLPSGWEIYVQPHLNGLRPDFVLLNPNAGIAVFEVKDWNLTAMRYYVKERAKGRPELWASRDAVDFCIQSQNPVTKVNLYKKEIFDLYCPRLQRGNGWAAVTAGVIFPFAPANAVKALLGPFRPKDPEKKYEGYQPIAGAEDVASGNLAAIFPEWGRKSSRVMSSVLADDLRGWLVEPDFAKLQRMPLILDSNQRALAETRTETGYRRIKGPAGSGKSLVLAARAARLANEDKTVLVATYNITLWHYLRDMIVRGLVSPDKFGNVTLTHFHLWCKHVCYDAGLDGRYEQLVAAATTKEAKDRALEFEVAKLAEEALSSPDVTRYDAILVDEGQDYRPLWWNVLRKACKPHGEVVLVADATQDIYGTAEAWTDEVMKGAGFQGGRWAQLNVSYRMPPGAIQFARTFAERFLPKGSVDLPCPERDSLNFYPCQLRWVQCEPPDAGTVAANEVVSLMRHTGIGSELANADIIVLTADMSSGSAITKELEVRKIKAVDTFGIDHRRKKMGFYMGDARVKATTLHSFKGWETRLLVVYVSNAAHLQSLALIYAGITRLKRDTNGSWLTVVCSAPELREFGSTFPDFFEMKPQDTTLERTTA
ncbi:conserved hypothetical protein [Mesorhizobium plurifarium]|uniref:DNA 3'-5' helicase II n=1 Tax=Mesorhizobium plurifarium TaxID=69974 RepID=A0A090GE83_MESPL|nr:conserved hypothetical protein [Mesorhizobium plurifarium]